MRFAVVTFAIIVAVPILHANVACQADAKLCPDGSTVGRQGPECEFAECPGVNGADCASYACADGTFDGNRCAMNSVAPCLQHGGVAGTHVCSDETKVCSDGSTVGRQGPACEFAECPESNDADCAPYICSDGTTHPSCAADGSAIYYFAAPCSLHGGDIGACDQDACGERDIAMPNWECPDGSVGGPACMQDETGTCGWRMRDCPNVTGFSDVPTSNEFSDAIFYVKSHGIVQGYPDGTYKPDTTINRAEFVKVLVESVSDSGMMCKIAAFTDVDQGSWYASHTQKARCWGFIEGYADGTFKPANSITFVESAKILAKAYGLEAITTVPACHGDCHWYREYVLMLEGKGAIPLSIVRLDQAITRGEMAEMIYRLRMGGGKPSRTYDELVRAVTETVFRVYFYTQRDVENASGEANIAVVRRVPYTSTVADTALRALFAGPTGKEHNAGARTTDDLSSLGAEYRGVTIHATYRDPYGGNMLQNVAIVDFGADAFEVLNGAAARQAMAKAAIEATLKQFPTIQNVFYAKDGVLFVEWDA